MGFGWLFPLSSLAAVTAFLGHPEPNQLLRSRSPQGAFSLRGVDSIFLGGQRERCPGGFFRLPVQVEKSPMFFRSARIGRVPFPVLVESLEQKMVTLFALAQERRSLK